MWHHWAASPLKGGEPLLMYPLFSFWCFASKVLDIEGAKDWATMLPACVCTPSNVYKISKMLSHGLTHPLYWRRSPRKTRGALNASPEVAAVPQPAAPPATMPESTVVQPMIPAAEVIALLMPHIYCSRNMHMMMLRSCLRGMSEPSPEACKHMQARDEGMLLDACEPEEGPEPEEGREQECDASKTTRSAKLGCSKCRMSRKGCSVCRAKAGLTPLPKRLSISPRKCAAIPIPLAIIPHDIA